MKDSRGNHRHQGTELRSDPENNEIVFVDFWAAWCGPYRMFAPTCGAAAERHRDTTFAKVDTEAEQALAAAAGITFTPPSWHEEVIQDEENLDMNEFRAYPPAAPLTTHRKTAGTPRNSTYPLGYVD
jgi:thioredoxin 1